MNLIKLNIKKPLLIAFILLSLGILIASKIDISFNLVAVAFFIVSIVYIFLRNRIKNSFLVYVFLALFLLGMLACLSVTEESAFDVRRLAKERDYYFKATIISSPDYIWGKWGNRKAIFNIKVEAVKSDDAWEEQVGMLRVIIKNNEKDYSYEDIILANGNLKKAYSYFKSKNIYRTLEVKNDDDIVTIPDKKIFHIKRNIHALRETLRRTLKMRLPYPDSSILTAMLVGKRSDLPYDVKDVFVKTGTAHILSISGLHVGLITAILFFALRLLMVPLKVSSIVILLFLSLFIIFAGERAPIIRASIMIAVYLISLLLEREFDIYASLSLAGIIILLINPMEIFNAGFVLSFSCVVSIVYITPRVENFFFKQKLKSPLNYIVKLCVGSISVYIGIAPIVAYYFKIVSPITIVANILIIPLLGVILTLGIIYISSMLFLTSLSSIVGVIIHPIIVLLIKIATSFSRIPFAYFKILDLSGYWIVCYYILLYLVLSRLKSTK